MSIGPTDETRASAPGPYETERAARADARDVYDLPPGKGMWEAAQVTRILAACRLADVEVGSYDRRIVQWLAGYEPEVVQVVIGLVLRAHAAGAGAE